MWYIRQIPCVCTTCSLEHDSFLPWCQEGKWPPCEFDGLLSQWPGDICRRSSSRSPSPLLLHTDASSSSFLPYFCHVSPPHSPLLLFCVFFFCSLYICFSTRTHTEPCAVDCRVLPTRPLSLAPEHAAVPPDSSPRLFLWVFFLFVFWPLSQYLFGRTPLEGFRITRPCANKQNHNVCVGGDEKPGRFWIFSSRGSCGSWQWVLQWPEDAFRCFQSWKVSVKWSK